MTKDSSNKLYTAYLLLGTNLGNRQKLLQQAIQQIENICGKIIAQSSIYETAAWGLTNQPKFLNQCIAVQTNITPTELMKKLLAIELALGRERIIKMGPRTIDIDMLLAENFVIENNILQVPHPRLVDRKFALTPLAEIAPTLTHPIQKQTIKQLLLNCTDTLDVYKI